MTTDPDPVEQEHGADGLDDVDDLGSGHLTEASRAAAVAAALPLVATYFVRRGTLALEAVPRLAALTEQTLRRGTRADDPVLAALRLRVALVAGGRLLDLLRKVVASANFRYERVRDEHVGHLHGQLDVVRYVKERGRRTVPRRYPVRDLRRSSVTPENVLAAFALLWFLQELDTATAVVAPPHDSPEAQATTAIRADLKRIGTNHVLRGAETAAKQVRRRESLPALLDTVEARIRAGHVTRPTAYLALTGWVRQSLLGRPLAEPGDLEAVFYGPEFDDRLFELWCLAKTGEALTIMFGEPRERPAHLLDRSPDPLYVWEAGADLVDVFFQPSLERLTGHRNRWRYRDGGRSFRAFPDVGVRCRHVDGSQDVVLLDAKLRRRAGPPSEEIYKLLGYFANTDGFPVCLGGIVFHDPTGYTSPRGARRYSLVERPEDSRGHVEAVGVDPGDTAGTADAFAVLAGLVLEATGLSRDEAESTAIPGASREPEDPEADEDEQRGSRVQELAVAQLHALAGRLPASMLDATAAHLRTVLGEAWPLLGSGVRRMVVTAVHFGDTAPDGADLAGPVLGLCAPLERLLRDRLAEPALSRLHDRPGCNPARWTLGTLLVRLEEATTDRPSGPASQALRRYLADARVQAGALAALLPELDRLRTRHRNKAAHQGLVERPQWAEVYRTVLAADQALLPRLVTLLPSSPVS